MRRSIITLWLSALTLTAAAQEKASFLPEVHGTVRTKYEYEPEIDAGRFEVRNCRVSIEGNVIPMIAYKAEIDLSDEGKIRMLDAYARLFPVEGMRVTVGQMRVPFTIDAHRSPHLQFFANRSFIAKQVGDVRDVGATAGYSFKLFQNPTTIEAGVFNGSGLTNQKHYWTKSFNYSAKASTLIANQLNITLSFQRSRPDSVGISMWNAGAYWQTERWHIEGEYLHKHYSGNAFTDVNAFNVFASYRIPVRKVLSGISFLGRYDYMDDHSNGIAGADGKLELNDHQRHRATGGVTLHFGKKKLNADMRLNYEKYFYRSGVTPGISDQDKVVVELMCHF